jgi:hypothetical protein
MVHICIARTNALNPQSRHLEQGPVPVHQLPPDNSDWRQPCREKAVMKLFQGEFTAHLPLVIIAQFQDLQFPDRIVEITGIANIRKRPPRLPPTADESPHLWRSSRTSNQFHVLLCGIIGASSAF